MHEKYEFKQLLYKHNIKQIKNNKKWNQGVFATTLHQVFFNLNTCGKRCNKIVS